VPSVTCTHEYPPRESVRLATHACFRRTSRTQSPLRVRLFTFYAGGSGFALVYLFIYLLGTEEWGSSSA
jgi:hypothetical protein